MAFHSMSDPHPITLDQATAFAEAYYEQIFKYCARRLPSRTDAEDATQEVFLRLVRGHASYVQQGKPLAYLYRIAHNVCADFFRRSGPPAASVDAELAERQLADPQAERPLRDLVLKDALEGLTDQERLVIELRYGDDLPVNEIAQILGCSRFSVHRIEKRALAALGEMLGGSDRE